MDIFPLNIKGIVKLKFFTSAQATWCLQKMNDRLFDGRKLACFYWDGTTDYRYDGESKEE